jgi:hypothetical protein
MDQQGEVIPYNPRGHSPGTFPGEVFLRYNSTHAFDQAVWGWTWRAIIKKIILFFSCDNKKQETGLEQDA